MTAHKPTAVSLLPCPFCGGEARAHQNELAAKFWRYRCVNCGAGPHGGIGQASAVAAWNRRAALAAQPEESAHPADGWVTVPRAALAWLFGEGPDQDGNHFGDDVGDSAPRYWWRPKFRAMLSEIEDR